MSYDAWLQDRAQAQGQTMKLIIAGGRNYHFSVQDYDRLDALLLSNNPICEVVSGAAEGADRAGEYWAAQRNIRVTRFTADWNRSGKAAGPIRNRQMAEYADAVALFPGGRGTASMYTEAKRLGLRIYDFRNP